MSNQPAAVWMKVWPDMKKDIPFFLSIGFACGMTQYLGYNFFDKSNFGTKILEEHIPFTSLMLLTIVVFFGKAAIAYRPKIFGNFNFLHFINHLSERAVAFSSVSAVVIFGFALAVAMFGSLGYSLKFMQASLYFCSLAEVAKNPIAKGGCSKIYPFSWGMVVTTPFLF
jgi:hypothetical protein